MYDMYYDVVIVDGKHVSESHSKPCLLALLDALHPMKSKVKLCSF